MAVYLPYKRDVVGSIPTASTLLAVQSWFGSDPRMPIEPVDPDFLRLIAPTVLCAYFRERQWMQDPQSFEEGSVTFQKTVEGLDIATNTATSVVLRACVRLDTGHPQWMPDTLECVRNLAESEDDESTAQSVAVELMRRTMVKTQRLV